MSIQIQRKKAFSLRELYSILIGLIPILAFYQVPFLGFGVATLIVGITIPYVFMYIFDRKTIPGLLFSVVVWIAYMIFRAHGSMQNIFLFFLVLLHIWGALKGSVDIAVLRKTIEAVSIAMTFFVLLQTIVYYTTRIQIMYLIKPLLLSENQYYADRVFTGLYRPSAFFLEPSHYTQYCCFGLLSVLFPSGKNGKADMRKAIWIALGCVLTTSGMGIAFCLGIFGWYALFSRKQQGKKLLSVIGWMIAGAAVFILLMQFDFFNTAVRRVFEDEQGHTAIWGRTLYWDSYIGTMSGTQLLIGHGLGNSPSGYMTGLMSLIYHYGYVGVALLAIVLIRLAVCGKNNFTVCSCVLYAGMLFVANKTGFLSYVFNLGMLAASAVEYQPHKISPGKKSLRSAEKTTAEMQQPG